MSIDKDILYKKKDNETWSDWNNRFHYYDEHKRDYIYDTIYTHCKSDLLLLVEPSKRLRDAKHLCPLALGCKPEGLDLPLATNKMKIALDITDIIINIDIKELIILLENTELLNDKFKEVYKIVCDTE
jgi:hypothetical protein